VYFLEQENNKGSEQSQSYAGACCSGSTAADRKPDLVALVRVRVRIGKEVSSLRTLRWRKQDSNLRSLPG
jgi:hypothetical protein